MIHTQQHVCNMHCYSPLTACNNCQHMLQAHVQHMQHYDHEKLQYNRYNIIESCIYSDIEQ